jgi:RNA polymerase sigma-70 factor (ECF subfamily)
MLPLDAGTVKRAQEGDADAFADIFNANRERVYAICLRMTSNAAEAEDLMQDSFMQAFRRLSTFRGDSALSTWLHRVAVNTVLMHFRKKAPHVISLDETSEREGKTLRRECGSRDGRLSGTVERIALTRALKELPVGYRNIYLLHDVHGYQHSEIADRLGCSVGNSKSQLHKAKSKLRQALARDPARVETYGQESAARTPAL